MTLQSRRRLLAEAKRLRQAHDPTGAAAALGAALAGDPGWADGLRWRAAVLLQSRRWSEALADLDACARLEAGPGWHHQLRAEAYLALGRPERALEDLAVAARWPRQSQLTRGLRGAALAILGRWDEAFPDLAAALAADPAPRLLLRLWGHVAAAPTGVLRGLAGSAEREAARRPELSWLPLLAGSAWFYAERPRRAVPLLEAAAAARVQDPYAHMNLGAALLNVGRPAEALRVLTRATALAPALARPLALRGEVLARLGRREEARRDFAAAVALDREGSLPRNWNDGLVFSGYLAESRPADAQSLLNHGRNLTNAFSPIAARAPLERAAALAPEWAAAHALLGEALLYGGRPWAAWRAFRRALQLEKPGEPAARFEDAPAYVVYRSIASRSIP